MFKLYFQAIDVWMASSIVFVFLSLIEFALVSLNYFKSLKTLSVMFLDSDRISRNANLDPIGYLVWVLGICLLQADFKHALGGVDFKNHIIAF